MRSLFTLTMLAAGILCCAKQVFAETTESAKPQIPAAITGAGRDEQDVVPEPVDDVRHTIYSISGKRREELRTFGVRQGQTRPGNVSPGTLMYFPEPLAALIEREEEGGTLRFLHDVSMEEKDGYVRGRVNLVNFNDSLKAIALQDLFDPANGAVSSIYEAAIRRRKAAPQAAAPLPAPKKEAEKPKTEHELESELAALLFSPTRHFSEKVLELRKWGIVISMQPWPLKNAFLVFTDANSGEVYGLAEADALDGTLEQAEFRCQVPLF